MTDLTLKNNNAEAKNDNYNLEVLFAPSTSVFIKGLASEVATPPSTLTTYLELS